MGRGPPDGLFTQLGTPSGNRIASDGSAVRLGDTDLWRQKSRFDGPSPSDRSDVTIPSAPRRIWVSPYAISEPPTAAASTLTCANVDQEAPRCGTEKRAGRPCPSTLQLAGATQPPRAAFLTPALSRYSRFPTAFAKFRCRHGRNAPSVTHIDADQVSPIRAADPTVGPAGPLGDALLGGLDVAKVLSPPRLGYGVRRFGCHLRAESG